MNDVIKHKIKHNAHRTLVSIKWVIFAILVGGIVGLCGTAFYFCLTFVTVLRGQDPWLLYLLPVGGLIIVLITCCTMKKIPEPIWSSLPSTRMTSCPCAWLL